VGIPESSAAWGVRRMAALMEKAEDLELDLSPDELAQVVREDFLNEHRALSAAMDGKALVEWLGDEAVKKLRAYDLARLKERQGGGKLPHPATPAVAPPSSNGHGKKSYKNWSEWEEEIARRTKE
jgi:hypothetical protein